LAKKNENAAATAKRQHSRDTLSSSNQRVVAFSSLESITASTSAAEYGTAVNTVSALTTTTVEVVPDEAISVGSKNENVSTSDEDSRRDSSKDIMLLTSELFVSTRSTESVVHMPNTASNNSSSRRECGPFQTLDAASRKEDYNEDVHHDNEYVDDVKEEDSLTENSVLSGSVNFHDTTQDYLTADTNEGDSEVTNSSVSDYVFESAVSDVSTSDGDDGVEVHRDVKDSKGVLVEENSKVGHDDDGDGKTLVEADMPEADIIVQGAPVRSFLSRVSTPVTTVDGNANKLFEVDSDCAAEEVGRKKLQADDRAKNSVTSARSPSIRSQPSTIFTDSCTGMQMIQFEFDNLV
jgi:hypothetical protein